MKLNAAQKKYLAEKQRNDEEAYRIDDMLTEEEHLELEIWLKVKENLADKTHFMAYGDDPSLYFELGLQEYVVENQSEKLSKIFTSVENAYSFWSMAIEEIKEGTMFDYSRSSPYAWNRALEALCLELGPADEI